MSRRALTLGAGVQSTAVLLMSEEGELPPFEVAVFADTQAEPAEVYEHLDRLDAATKTPIVRVTAGSLTARLLDTERRDGIQIPAFMLGVTRRDGILRRQCTERFKSRPVYKWLGSWREREHVDLTFGISMDEAERMRDPRRKWLTNEYPLVDRRLTRHHCKRWLDARGWSTPRSACVYCPYHSDNEWRRLRDEHPADWAEAVRVDDGMRAANEVRVTLGRTSLTGTPFVHRSLRPLSEVDLSTAEDHGQGSMFGAECEGMCGI